MTVSSYTADLRDIEFVLFEQLEIQKILGRGPFAHVAEAPLRMILQLGSEFASKHVAPTNVISDQTGCRWEGGRVFVPEVFHPLWKTLREQEWIGLVAPLEWGGQGLPRTVGYAVDEMIIAANTSFHTYLNLNRAASNMLLHYGSEELKATYVPRLLAGEWQGTMCLTEPGAGSDVGASICRATPVAGGGYKISGTKVFITAGEHDMAENHVHLVLARTPDAPAGVKGLSLFLVPKIRINENGVPKEPNDIYCSKIEEKLGMHGSATTVLNFGDHDGCLGYLVGEINQGILCMFDMMNESRIGVGLQGQALAAAMFQHALTYARERIQGSDISRGKSITQAKVPIVEHPDVRRMLMNVRAVAEGGRALLYATSLQLDLAAVAEDASERQYHEGRASLLTPICKAWTSDAGIDACSQALQVFGGSGYLSDYPAEQYLRDVRITPIYEGTNGIQAIDLLFRKVLGPDRRSLESWHEDVSSWIRQKGKHPELAREIAALEEAEGALIETTQFLDKKLREDTRLVALGAGPYLTMFGNVVVGWLLLQQADLADSKLASFALPPSPEARRKSLEDQPQARFYAGKVEMARFFVRQSLSQNRWRVAQIMSGDRSAIDVMF